ncbi:Cysteine--tRNA ligase [Commensalibacter sp. Nvir]|uniref:cysteine--tRNA ligase n=1 Tax=Commensalibacter sp. Nvir TaxID=3069817 RepID=UPI002D2A4ECE|nr:Cysteine--tRNA ligase [Commensalibacter sp. Nvir]
MNNFALSLYDSRRRRLVPFKPLDSLHVRLYFCGPTVYDLLHIGNLRAMLTADILVRVLRLLYPKVTYVRNITDVDDKINIRAAENKESIHSLTERTTREFHKDMRALYICPPDVEPKATDHIQDIQTMVRQLIQNGNAYEADGHVLFSVASYSDYGSLSGRNPEELLAGARVEVASYKKDPGDFVLWKPSSDNEPGWDSPWGRGRPGWHIECSAMSHRYLGESFDIHGGGHDLLFPHHENECAQSLCCFPGSQFAKIWVHNAMLLVDGEKMSKSLGNFFTIREVLENHNPEVIRFSLLQAHYRSVSNFSSKGLQESKQIMDRFYRALQPYNLTEFSINNQYFPSDFMEAMGEDLNTPKAIMIMHQYADKALKGDRLAALKLKQSGSILGLFNQTSNEWFQSLADKKEIVAMIQERNHAKQEKNFIKADQIRNKLKEQGIVLEDSSEGTTWRQE